MTITGHADTDLTLAPASASLTFTADDWDTAQTVTVEAGEDDDAAGDTETLLHTATGGGYDSVTKDLGVTVTDNDEARLALSKASLGVTEGSSDTYTVKLATQPTAQVTVTITGHADTDLTLAPASASLTFTADDWDTAQTVTVEAGEDDDAAGDTETLLHTATGGGYDSVTKDLGGNGDRQRRGAPGAVEGVAGRHRREQRHLHGEARHAADGPGDGDDHRPRGHRPDAGPGVGESDVHGGRLGHGADGDGGGGRGRRRGRRYGDAAAHGDRRRLRLGDQGSRGNGDRQRRGAPGAVEGVAGRHRREQRHLHGEARHAADGPGDGDDHRPRGHRPDAGPGVGESDVHGGRLGHGADGDGGGRRGRRRGRRYGDAAAHGDRRRLRLGDQGSRGNGDRQRRGAPGAVEGVAGRHRREQRHLHGEARHAADGPGDGDDHRPRGHRPDAGPGVGESDVHGGRLGHGADGDGGGGRGRRRGRRYGDAAAHGDRRRLRLGDQGSRGNGDRQRRGAPGAVEGVAGRHRREQRHLHGEARHAADGPGDGDDHRPRGHRPDAGPGVGESDVHGGRLGHGADGDGGGGRGRRRGRRYGDAAAHGDRRRLRLGDQGSRGNGDRQRRGAPGAVEGVAGRHRREQRHLHGEARHAADGPGDGDDHRPRGHRPDAGPGVGESDVHGGTTGTRRRR